MHDTLRTMLHITVKTSQAKSTIDQHIPSAAQLPLDAGFVCSSLLLVLLILLAAGHECSMLSPYLLQFLACV